MVGGVLFLFAWKVGTSEPVVRGLGLVSGSGRRCPVCVCVLGMGGASGGLGERLTRKECGFLPALDLFGTIS